MIYIIIGIVGFVMILFGNDDTILVGCAILVVDTVAYAVGSLLRENTGDVKGDIVRLCTEHGGVATERGDDNAMTSQAEIGDVIELRRGTRAFFFVVNRRHGSAAAGGAGGGLFITINTQLTVNKDFDVRVGRKTLLRLGDKYAGSDCVFYGAETVALNGKKLLVAGKDKQAFITMMRHDRSLAFAVENIIFDMDYGEFRVGTGGDDLLKLGKRYARHDTEPKRVLEVLDAADTIMNRLDSEDMVSRTRPRPRAQDSQKGISIGFVIALIVVIAIFIYAMSKIP